jgi:hypothetical protein
MILTANLDHTPDPNPRFPTGTRHTVFVTVTDGPGEAGLRQIRVGIADLDPTDFSVTCDAGPNGTMSLELHQSLHCTAEFPAETGDRAIVVTATAQVPGLRPQAATQTLHYTGFAPPPPPQADPPAPAHHSAPLQPGGGQQADPRPSSKLPIMTTPLGPLPGTLAPADPPPTSCPSVGSDVGRSGAAAGAAVTGTPGNAGTAGTKGTKAAPGTGCCPSTTGAARMSGTAPGAAACCPPTGGAAAAGTAGATRAAGTAGAASSTCCPSSGNARTAGTHQDESAKPAGGACAAPESRAVVPDPKPASQGTWGLPLTGTSAPLLGAAALAVAVGGAGLIWLARLRAARR